MKNKRPNPKKYNNSIAEESNNCVKGSVEGVKIAPRIVDINIIYRQAPSICSTVIIFNNPIKICKIGI